MNHVAIDTVAVPASQQAQLGTEVVRLLKEFLQQPGAEEKLAASYREYQQKRSAPNAIGTNPEQKNLE